MRSFLSALTLSFLLLTAVPVEAQWDFSKAIVPDAHEMDPAHCPEGAPLAFGAVMEIMHRIVNVIIGAAFLILTLMLVYAGFLFVTAAGSAENVSKAKSALTNAIIGMVIVLCAWLIIDFVMRALYSGPDGSEGKWGPWNSLITQDGEWCIEKTGTKPLFGDLDFSTVPDVDPQAPPSNPNLPSGGGLTHAAAQQKLSAAGISVSSSGNCSDRTKSTCTSLDGMQPETITQVIQIKSVCGKALTVTGGTETGHSSGHTNGNKIDLATNIDSCIQGGASGYFTRNGSRGSDPRYLDKCQNVYVREPDHWDITVSGVCSK